MDNLPQHTKKWDYEIDLVHLCPNKPEKNVISCTENFKVSHYVSQMLNQEEITPEKAIKLSELVRCNLENVPHIEVSIEIYCYMGGF